MNIGIICHSSCVGSVFISTHLALELAQRGHQIHLFSHTALFSLWDQAPPRERHTSLEELYMELFSSEAFFQTENRMILSLLRQSPSVLEAIPSLPTYIEKVIKPEILGEVEDGAWVETGRVRLESGAKIERGAIVRGPTIIGKDTVVRSGAYIRGHLLTGKGCLIGHGTEIRQIILMDESNLPHLNCIFTSIIGSRVNIAGNTHTANMLINRREVEVRVKMNGQSQTLPTGQTWFGSIIGDDSSIGALSLLQPGTVIGQRCLIYPQCSVSGYIHSDSLVRPTFAPFEVVPR